MADVQKFIIASLKKTILNRFLFLSLLTPISLHSYGQYLNIVGKVLDQENATPIPYAYVTLNDSSHIITNEKGLFTFNVSQIGFEGYYLDIQMLDYLDQRLENVGGNKDTLNIKLNSAPVELQEVVVLDNRRRKFTATEIVKLAIDSLYSKQKKEGLSPEERNIYGYYNQLHYSLPMKSESSSQIKLRTIFTVLRIL